MTAAAAAATLTIVPRRVLIIEDEVLISMVLEDMLGMIGHQVAGVAANFAEAEAAIGAGGFDLVIADVNLGPDAVFPLADRVMAAGIPLILATGSHRDTLPPRFAAVPVLEKPYAYAAIETTVAQIS